MWLPRDERKLLAGYYHLLSEVEKSKGYSIHELGKLLAFRPNVQSVVEYGRQGSKTDDFDLNNIERCKDEIKKLADLMYRMERANKALVARKLISVKKHQHETDVVFVELSIDGYDLGRRYAHWWDRSGLRFQEYRNHWVWLIVCFLGGVLGAVLINFLVGK